MTGEMETILNAIRSEFHEMMLGLDEDFQTCWMEFGTNGTVCETLRKQLWKENRWEELENRYKEMLQKIAEDQQEKLAGEIQKMKLDYIKVDRVVKREVIRQELKLLEQKNCPISEKSKILDEIAEGYQRLGYPECFEVLTEIECIRGTWKQELLPRVFPVASIPAKPESLPLIKEACLLFCDDEILVEQLVEREQQIKERLEEIEQFRQKAEEERKAARYHQMEMICRQQMQQVYDCLQHGRAAEAESLVDRVELREIFGPEVYYWNRYLVRGEILFERYIKSQTEWPQMQSSEELIQLKYGYRMGCLEHEVVCRKEDADRAADLWCRCEGQEKQRLKKLKESKNTTRGTGTFRMPEREEVERLIRQPGELLGLAKVAIGKSKEMAASMMNEIAKEPMEKSRRYVTFRLDENSGMLQMEERESV